jgi:glutamyl-tRNA reductase
MTREEREIMVAAIGAAVEAAVRQLMTISDREALVAAIPAVRQSAESAARVQLQRINIPSEWAKR